MKDGFMASDRPVNAQKGRQGFQKTPTPAVAPSVAPELSFDELIASAIADAEAEAQRLAEDNVGNIWERFKARRSGKKNK
jgi:hypothetical protein